ncbi:site-2 protease family protein [Solemya velum gill symbiont]|uniref:Zn-dependent protease n=3 Tax=Solemya velum gill symbiont TaxID=2340 RepID=A0A0B0HAJ9_SOVGS|nr:site-2 protease family protein [Solemya velum gill symbiont]KHF25707.1 Zn-dependent protease [Solemya velum gill symbiont]OOY48472.1 site-2 protease family protein [Solemya velum gill symbiont]OOY52093.1 site-2 protease family protein [Solemya velum gill symbiont]OOY53329.1 site-2 protease family protein [Solemya velum gill symbiont]OOY55755.1 site-2 protease family protein [Solemya velum gill symbiont]
MPELNIIQQISALILPLIFAVTLHEAAHGWVADKLGDDTARKMGRITLNPLPHIDWIGTVLLPVGMLLLTGFVFGYAKPVPVNVLRLGNMRRDMALVALAGPGSNLVMMIMWGLVAKFATTTGIPSITQALVYMAFYGVLINAVLALLNLLPILPLDGGRVLASILPPNLAEPFSRLEPFGMIILIVLLVSGFLGHFLWPAIGTLQNLTFSLYGIN